jgi:hypothetical protein
LIERAIAEAPDLEGVLMLLDENAKVGREFSRTELYSALRKVVTEERPLDHIPGACELIALPVDGLRKELFRIAAEDRVGGRLASQCLEVLDAIRDEHDWRHLGPRHPDIEFGRPWPLPIGGTTTAL